MGIERILNSNTIKVVRNFLKKPAGQATAVVGGLGLLAGYTHLTTTKKERAERANQAILSNPFLNPLGFGRHLFNPKADVNSYDCSLARYLVNRNNEKYDEYYNNLSPQEKIKEFYENGGKGVRFDDDYSNKLPSKRVKEFYENGGKGVRFDNAA